MKMLFHRILRSVLTAHVLPGVRLGSSRVIPGRVPHSGKVGGGAGRLGQPQAGRLQLQDIDLKS